MDLLFNNHAESTLTGAITAAAVSLTVQTPDASKFPNPVVSTQAFLCTLMRRNTGEREIVLVTARAGAVLTIQRAQEGTAALSFAAGDVVSARLTKRGLHNVPRRRNLLDNAAFQVWQKGTSFAAPGAFGTGPDRWAIYRTGFVAGATYSRQAGGEAQYCLRAQRDSGNSAVDAILTGQVLETVDSLPLRGKWLTLTFRARCGANFSAAGSALSGRILDGEGTDQSIHNMTSSSVIGSVVATLTTSWQEFTCTTVAPVEATTTQVGVQFFYTPVGTAGVSDYFEIELVDLEVGEYAGAFPYKSYAEELARCQRFLPALDSSGTNAPFGVGQCFSSTLAAIYLPFPVRPRAAVTGVVVSNNTHFSVLSSVAAAIAATSVAFNRSSLSGAEITVAVAAGLAAGNATVGFFNNASGRLHFTGAEI